ncbi:hypothetical protein MD484_g3248, partial [Candolleomyces efflorescens]
MAPSSNPYQNTPQPLPKPHPTIAKLSDQLFVFTFNDEPGRPRENLITAAEIAECIKLDGLLRQGQSPKRWHYLYPTIAYHFNHDNTLDHRRFIEYNPETDVFTHTDSPRPSFEDFGIRPEHVSGSRQPNNSLITDRSQEKVVFGALIDSIQRKKGSNDPEGSKKRRRVERELHSSSSTPIHSIPSTPLPVNPALGRSPVPTVPTVPTDESNSSSTTQSGTSSGVMDTA